MILRFFLVLLTVCGKHSWVPKEPTGATSGASLLPPLTPSHRKVYECPAGVQSSSGRGGGEPSTRSNSNLRIAFWNAEMLFLPPRLAMYQDSGRQAPRIPFETVEEMKRKRNGNRMEVEEADRGDVFLEHLDDVRKMVVQTEADIFVLAEVQDCSVLEQELLPSLPDHSAYLTWSGDTYTGQNLGLVARGKWAPQTPISNLKEEGEEGETELNSWSASDEPFSFPSFIGWDGSEFSGAEWSFSESDWMAFWGMQGWDFSFEPQTWRRLSPSSPPKLSKGAVSIHPLDLSSPSQRTELAVISAHLVGGRESPTQLMRRVEQARELRREAERQWDLGRHVVVLGDFNERDLELEESWLAACLKRKRDAGNRWERKSKEWKGMRKSEPSRNCGGFKPRRWSKAVEIVRKGEKKRSIREGKLLLRNALEKSSLPGEGVDKPFPSSHSSGFLLDHILVDEELMRFLVKSSINTEGLQFSDHSPIVAEFRF